MRNLFALLLIMLVSVGIVHAQADGLDETFVTSNGMLSFGYSSEWTLEEEDGSVYVESDDLLLGVFSSLTISGEMPSTLEDFVQLFMDNNPSYDFEDTDSLTLESGMDALRADFTFSGQPEGTVAFLLAFEEGDGYVLILANGEDEDDLSEVVTAIADTVTLDSGGTSPADETEPLVLDIGEGDINNWNDVVDTLRDAGLVAGDGELLFETDFSTTVIGGVYNISRDSESTYPNSAGGALVSFRPGDETLNVCGFALRTVIEDEENVQFLFVGVDAFDNLQVLGRGFEEAGPDDPGLAEVPSDAIFHNPNYLHYVLNDNQLTVFVNGVAMIEGLKVPLPDPNSRGEVEPSMAGLVLQRSCVMTDAWIYGFEGG